MKKNIALAAILIAASLTVACSSTGNKAEPIARPAVSDSGISTSGTGAYGAGAGSKIAPPAVTPPASTASRPAYDLADKTIYFSYDGADIDSAGEAVVSNFGKYLTANSSAKVRLEGHTDERGSAEYNVALGERRAQSVARALKGAGATDAQLSVVSYGKERPAVQGHDEAAFAKNRRVEITQP